MNVSGSAADNLTTMCVARMSASAFRVSQTHKSQYAPSAVVIGW